jgi:hypothetical protein
MSCAGSDGAAANEAAMGVEIERIQEALADVQRGADEDLRRGFLLANQTQPHGHCQGVNARVRRNPESFAKLSELVNDPDFKANLDFAANNPSGKDARILNTVTPLLVVSSASVPSPRHHQVVQLCSRLRLSNNALEQRDGRG